MIEMNLSFNNIDCKSCGKKVITFKDKQSIKEFKISGLCQDCQDEVLDTANTAYSRVDLKKVIDPKGSYEPDREPIWLNKPTTKVGENNG